MRICVISLSPLAKDPRIQNQIATLLRDGHNVKAVGLQLLNSDQLECEVSWVRFEGALLDRLTRLMWVGLARIFPWWTNAFYWRMPEIISLWGGAQGAGQADLYLANDWPALPIAARLARKHNGAYAYDTHEFGVSEASDRLYWRLLFPPFIKAVEGAWIDDAQFVSCVSKGISEGLFKLYRLQKRPTVIKNVPAYRKIPFRGVNKLVHVLYHGLLQPGRGLEETIASVRLWSPKYRLIIRGYGRAKYEGHLKGLAERYGVVDRVTFAPPVTMNDLIPKANVADIGLFCSPGGGGQFEHVLPNKIFEYIMAGLALCVTSLPDMKHIIDTYNVGVCSESEQPADIAAAINSMDAARIEAYKRNSLVAAKDLCTESEYEKLLMIISN